MFYLARMSSFLIYAENIFLALKFITRYVVTALRISQL